MSIQTIEDSCIVNVKYDVMARFELLPNSKHDVLAGETTRDM